MKKFGKLAALLSTALIISGMTPLGVYAEEDAQPTETVISESSFENGDITGWYAFGERSKIYVNRAKAHTGSTCLTTSDREISWSGPGFSFIDYITNDTSLYVKAYVMSEDPAGAAIQITVKTVDKYGNEHYNLIAACDSTSTSWTEIEGTFTPDGEVTEAEFYIETVGVTTDFSIDDVLIKTVPRAEEPSKEITNEYFFDFEEGWASWMPIGTVNMELSNRFSYKGRNSLYISGRKEFWNIIATEMSDLILNEEYEYSAYVMFNGREFPESVNFQIKLQYMLNDEETKVVVAEREIQKGTWSRVTGKYTLPEGSTDILMTIMPVEGPEDNENLLSFFLDDVSVQNYEAVKHKKNIVKLVIVIVSTVVALALAIVAAIFFIKRTKKRKDELRSACIDAMTNTYNRNVFEEKMRAFTENPDKIKKVFITVCDVNSLKYINDNYGHENGDKAITRCASVLLKAIGRKGKVYRTGGDEFICMCDEDLTEVIRMEFAIEVGKYKGYPFDAAVGTASYDKEIDGNTPDVKAIFARADKEMYKHKQELKNNSSFTE